MKKSLYLLMILSLMLILSACTPSGEEAKKATTEEKNGLENGEFDLDHEGRNIHYRIHGQGPEMMVLTNAWGITSNGLRNLFKCLESDFTMIYFDSRGMGASSPVAVPEDMGSKAAREDFEILRKHLKLEKVILLGWSHGAMNATSLLAETPEGISKAIMVHGAFYSDPADMDRYAKDYPELMQSYPAYIGYLNNEQNTEEEKEAYHREFLFDSFLPILFKDREAGKEKLKELLAEATFSYKHNVYIQMVDSAGFDTREMLKDIAVPVLVIAGSYDMNPPERLEAAAAAMQDGTFVLFEESGHYSMLEETDKFIKVIKEFVAK